GNAIQQPSREDVDAEYGLRAECFGVALHRAGRLGIEMRSEPATTIETRRPDHHDLECAWATKLAPVRLNRRIAPAWVEEQDVPDDMTLALEPGDVVIIENDAGALAFMRDTSRADQQALARALSHDGIQTIGDQHSALLRGMAREALVARAAW